MSMTDPISNLLATIRNGQLARLASVTTPSSKAKKALLDVLVREGYIRAVSEEVVRAGVKELVIDLKYFEGQPAIRTLERISKPGRRVYSSIGEVRKVANGLGVSILSTSKGLMADHEARAANVGGEVLCEVF